MSIKIGIGPCCWGVDDPKNPHLPNWRLVLKEAAEAGYKGIELGPYGYLPLDISVVKEELKKNDLTVIVGTIFDDLVSPENKDNLLKMTEDICKLIRALPRASKAENQHFQTPYLTIMDFGHKERSMLAGHYDRAPRLSKDRWNGMIENIKEISKIAWEKYGVRPVIHPHAGGYIEFEDEIKQVLEDIPYGVAGLCLDTGHLYYSGMDPVSWIRDNAERLDYIHFKDIDKDIYNKVMAMEIDFFDACAKGVMCPIGKGIINYSGINALLKEINYQGWITIEQERDPRNSGTSLQDVSQSHKYLKSVGY
ncbi:MULTISPECIES: sugar phosphate isomerase/epimerase family protein [Pelosinus]|jgi:inosose dehydratase|uniref:Xylose isomerase domain-containing protein TIM barrel n=1 Tax=Pelosinus fermentans B4 TaxID=1149862 RepID=I9LB04_9FIRM|nr:MULTISPECIES: TIM barrel protein [Pelosinus]EIW17501.1 Xylose isomerase domain-containing protein TIM barrel [Pelosinus fermentans B4]EIW23561.1 Xylose isomerase domain-containing protein TIM barrel [Pelosinus fermentans A11]OAM92056.1 Myo-inosose-2 dehydratase [Pelosinus fermentans DSM 17108]SDQ32148.1 2-keto-myo-inositol dehydratase [Pelosinus fermentans]